MPLNYFTLISNAILQLFTAQGDYFLSIGQAWFKYSLLLAWGLALSEMVLLGANRHRIGRLFVISLFGLCFLQYYSAPAPFLGSSFPGLVLDSAASLSDRLEAGSNQTAQDALNAAYVELERPAVWNVTQFVYYFAVIVLLALVRLALLAVVAFGFLAVAMLKLFGPLAVASLLWPGLEFIFWGWLRSFLQYASYQPVAAAMVFLSTAVLTQFFAAHPLPWSLNMIEASFIELITAVGTIIFFVTRVPSFVASAFSGRAGESFMSRG